jgi:hypothetical protein
MPSAGLARVGFMTADTPAEAVLLDEPTTADLAAKVTEAWRDFANALTTAIPDLPRGIGLTLTLDPTASGTGDAVYSVDVAVEEDGSVHAHAVGNAGLPREYRLGRAQIAEMVALGWSPPGVLPGSGEDFGLRVVPAPDAARVGPGVARLAVVVSRTLRDVYGAPHPAFVTYLPYGDDAPACLPLAAARLLGPAGGSGGEVALREPAIDGADHPGMPLEDRVQAVVAHLMRMTPEALQLDHDGDIGIRSGSAMVFVRVRDNPPLIDVFSPVLTEIEPSEKLYSRLSELTNRMPIGRLYCTQGTVWASVPVFGRDFQPTHLMLAVQVMTGLADELDDRLHGEFGGKRFFAEGDKAESGTGGRPLAGPKDESERTGMYL